jgi:hypothetical protein
MNLDLCLYGFIFIDNKYKVTVYTGNKREAGTDADVFITLYGTLGESDAIMLYSKKNDFEGGKCVLIYFILFLFSLLFITAKMNLKSNLQLLVN